MTRARGLLLSALAFIGAMVIFGGHAAGYDCTRASTVTEKMICADPEASHLDGQLNALFARLRGTHPDLVKEQRAWITSWRDSCGEINCLRQAYRVRVAELTTIGSCPVTSAGISGAWSRVQGEGFEQMSLSVDGGQQLFVSWLHNRPEFTGTWVLQNCVLSVRHAHNQSLSFDYRVERLEGGRLTLRDVEEKTATQYTRSGKRK